MSAALPIFAINQGEYTDRVRGALQTAFGRLGHPVKHLAKCADVNITTAKNWLDGRSTPQGLHLLRLFAMVPELQAEVRRLTGMMADGDPEFDRALNDLLALHLRKRQRALEADG